MNSRWTPTLALAAYALTATAVAADAGPPEDKLPAGLDITMRVVENPDALAAEAITRRIELPLPSREHEVSAEPPDAPVDGRAVSEAAREGGREFGQEVADRARSLAEEASEQREEFGRGRAEERRPERPERPEPPERPTPPRP